MDKNKKSYNPNLTEEDKELLGKKQENLRSDGGDDKQLDADNRTRPVDFAGEDLDIPGRNLKKDRSESDLKDEENQLYSQGGAENSHLEETDRSKPND